MADSELARRSGLSLAQFVRIYRNQISDDPRPNKDLFELPQPADPDHRAVVKRWNSVVCKGVQPLWNNNKPHTQTTRSTNHNSMKNLHQDVLDHIVKGQHDGRYLVVEADLLDVWADILISPKEQWTNRGRQLG
ncbi:hypothetical protein ON010_g8909 [Phytophthora cinnamomi]|nr:hypothetical protein ON010_g8909 [Phytophthora cinnamomi]